MKFNPILTIVKVFNKNDLLAVFEKKGIRYIKNARISAA
jgi:hypothetical protein